MQKHRNQPYTAEELVLIQSCLDDGWPFSELHKTYGFQPKAAASLTGIPHPGKYLCSALG